MTRLGLEIIAPRQLFDVPQIKRILDNSAEGLAKDIAIDFNVTAQTWNDAPKAAILKKGVGRRDIVMTDERYFYVNNGTKPHVIRPVRASILAFPANYRAKTAVRSISSTSGGSYGPTVYAREVNHPGTKARHFDEEIAKKWNSLLPGVIQRAILSEL